MKSTNVKFQDGQVFRVAGPTDIQPRRLNGFHLYGALTLITVGLTLGFLIFHFIGQKPDATAFRNDTNDLIVKTSSEASVAAKVVTSTEQLSIIRDTHQYYGQLTEEMRDGLCLSSALVRNATTDGRCYYMLLTDVNRRQFIINYVDNMRCTYLFLTRHNCRIKYNFYVDTETNYDYFNVTNGFTTAKYTGTYGSVSGTTKEEFLKIYFHTDGGSVKSSISVSFNAVRIH